MDKQKRSIFGSLSFRVLLISFFLVTLPLILYSFYVYTTGYHEKVHDLRTEVSLFKEDKINSIHQLEKNYLDFLVVLEELTDLIREKFGKLEDQNIMPVFKQLAQKEGISALFYLEYKSSKNLECTFTTQPHYKGVNFAPYFMENKLKKTQSIFIAKDPVFGHSLYLLTPDIGSNGLIEGYLGFSISLETLIQQLVTFKTFENLQLSIVSRHWKVLASSEKNLVSQQFQEKSIHKNRESIELKKSSYPEIYEFSLDGTKNFALMENLPHTQAYLLISIEESYVMKQLMHYVHHLIFLLAFIVIVGGGITAFLTWRMTKPLKRLLYVMQAVGAGKFDQRYVADFLGFEINSLGDTTNSMIDSLVQHIEQVKQERAAKEAYEKELQIGHDIQKAILPVQEMCFPGLEMAISFTPAKEVAGDFYDWMIDEEHILVTIADGVGKGVSGCLYAFDLRSILRAFAKKSRDLREIVSETNTLFCEDTKDSGSFVTAFVASYEKASRTLTYVNCGHNYPFIKKESGDVHMLKSQGIAFGVGSFDNIDIQQETLGIGDFIILYTDGITDAQNPQKELYGEKRLQDLIDRSEADTSDALMKEILEEIHTFVGGADQYDDMTLIIFKVH